jgi:hypothetical protein
LDANDKQPEQQPSWARELNRTDVFSEASSSPSSKVPNLTPSFPLEAQIVSVPRVYELLDGTPVPKYHDDEKGEGYYMPEYEKVFQGF